jgi:AraC family transcriptional regulator
VGRRPTASARLEYDRRVNRVIEHIRKHLAEPLTLGELARVAAFSPFHFDRVFKAVAGETLFGFVQRVRVDRAASALLARRDASVLEIALDHGFASAATSARAFRARFGMSATRWRAGSGVHWRARHGRNPGKHLRKLRKAGGRRARNARGRKQAAMSVRVQQQPCGSASSAGARRTICSGPDTITLGVTNDDPGISGDKARYDACVVVSREFAPDRLVNMMDIPSGPYAVAGFVGTARDIVPAWEQVFAAWLPGSGYQPDDRPCYELYGGDPTINGTQGSFRCDLCLPVRPL